MTDGCPLTKVQLPLKIGSPNSVIAKSKEVSFTNLMLQILKLKCLKKSNRLSRESLKLRELKKMLSRRGSMRNLMRMRLPKLKESVLLLKKRKSARSERRKGPKVASQRRKRPRSRDPSLQPSEFLPRRLA